MKYIFKLHYVPVGSSSFSSLTLRSAFTISAMSVKGAENVEEDADGEVGNALLSRKDIISKINYVGR